MIRSYTVRLLTTNRQSSTLQGLLVHLCELYNAALQERRDAWRICQKRVSEYDQHQELTQLRAIDAESASFPATIQRDPLRRVRKAFDGFFRRIKLHQDPGYPRFKSSSRYDCFTVDSQNAKLRGDRLKIVKLGEFRFRTRCRIKGIIKQVHVKRHGGNWLAVIVCNIGAAPQKTSVSNPIGIDVGLTSLITLSDGSVVENPRWTRQSEEALAKASRSLSRKQRGSRNRAKARERVRRVHERIQGRRRSYLHAVSRWLVSQYDLVAYEKLDIRGMVEGRFAKSIMDAAWGELIWQLTYKAESAGKWVVPINPRGTTQLCSGCGTTVPKEIWQRRHDCPQCGLSLGRDHNGAINVLQRGLCCAGLSAGVQV